MRKVKVALEKGQTIFELVMAISVGVVIITAVVILVTTSLNNSTFAKNNAQATRYSQEAVEWLRSERDKSWSTFYSKSGAATQYYCLTNLSWPQGGNCSSSQIITNTPFLREVSLTNRDLDGSSENGQETVEAKVTVVWEDKSGSHVSTLTTQYTDWRTNE